MWSPSGTASGVQRRSDRPYRRLIQDVSAGPLTVCCPYLSDLETRISWPWRRLDSPIDLPAPGCELIQPNLTRITLANRLGGKKCEPFRNLGCPQEKVGH